MSYYSTSIRKRLAELGYENRYDVRHIEAWMRIAHSTLDGLPADEFRAEVDICRECIDETGRDASESLAASFGL